MDRETIDGLNVALIESTITGIRSDAIELHLDVHALPGHGPEDPDPRRVLALDNPSRIRVLLRKEYDQLGPDIPLSGLLELEAFFASLSVRSPMEGVKFLDVITERTRDWPARVSLDVELSDGRDYHSLYWTTECARPTGDGDDLEWFYLEGVVWFEDVTVSRADGTPVALNTFISDGRRWMDALFAGP